MQLGLSLMEVWGLDLGCNLTLTPAPPLTMLPSPLSPSASTMQ